MSKMLTLITVMFLLALGAYAGAQEPVEKVSKSSYTITLTKLDAAFKSARLLILGEFDYQRMQKMVGKNIRGAKGFNIFRPDLGIPIFENDYRASLEIPLKLVVYEREDGKVVIRYRRPSEVFKPYKGLSDLGKSLDKLLDELTDAAIK